MGANAALFADSDAADSSTSECAQAEEVEIDIDIDLEADVDNASSFKGDVPDWVAVALGCYVLAACLNSLAWLSTDIDDDETALDESTLGSGSEERHP